MGEIESFGSSFYVKVNGNIEYYKIASRLSDDHVLAWRDMDQASAMLEFALVDHPKNILLVKYKRPAFDPSVLIDNKQKEIENGK